MVGTNLRFFSERVFGAWVDGHVTRVTEKWVYISACFGGANWSERKPRSTEFYRPSGHPEAGQSFHFPTA